MISRAKFNLLLGGGSPEKGVTVGNTNINIINNIGHSYSVTNSFSCLSYLMWFIFDLLEQIVNLRSLSVLSVCGLVYN